LADAFARILALVFLLLRADGGGERGDGRLLVRDARFVGDAQARAVAVRAQFDRAALPSTPTTSLALTLSNTAFPMLLPAIAPPPNASSKPRIRSLPDMHTVARRR
jgi:hypothetical protein